jgi:hypothetical protein
MIDSKLRGVAFLASACNFWCEDMLRNRMDHQASHCDCREQSGRHWPHSSSKPSRLAMRAAGPSWLLSDTPKVSLRFLNCQDLFLGLTHNSGARDRDDFRSYRAADQGLQRGLVSGDYLIQDLVQSSSLEAPANFNF